MQIPRIDLSVSHPKSTEKFFWKKEFTEDNDETGFELEEEAEPLEEITLSLSDRRQFASATTAIRAKPQIGITVETKLVVGIPAHNSERSIASAIVSLRPLEADIVVCDDHSSDETEEIARALGCKIVRHPRELGVSDSVTSIFIAARRLHATCLLTVDPEMNFVMRDALNLLEKVQRGECDIAIGSDRSPDDFEASPEDTIEGVRDPNSLFRAYSRRALALIAPAGTTSVVNESDMLQFAKQQGLRVKEYRISSAPSERKNERTINEKLRSLPSTTEARFSKLANLAVLKHPLLFFGIPSVAMLLASILQAIITIQSWGSTGVKADYGFYYAGYDIVISLLLGIGALILESQRVNSGTMRRRIYVGS